MIRNILKHSLLAVAALSVAAVAGAAEPSQARLNEVIEHILSVDPVIGSRVQSAEAEESSLQAENTLASPELEFEHLWGGEHNRWSASVSQEIEWPGLYGGRSRRVQLQRSMSAALLDIYTFDRALTLKLLYIDLVNAARRCQLYSEIAANIDSIASATQASFDMGEATILDLRKSQIAVVNAHADYRTAQADYQNVVAGIAGFGVATDELASLPHDTYPLQPLTDPQADFDAAWSRYLQAGADVAANDVKLAKLSSLPSFSVGYVHAYEDATHFNGLTVAITLPSFSRKKRIEAAQHQLNSVLSDNQAAMISARAECNSQYVVATGLKASLAEYAGLIDDNSYLALLKDTFDSGEMTVVDYITEINLFRQSRLTYIDLEYRYNLALTRSNRYRSVGF